MNEQPSIELKALCGERVLTGVDRNKESFKDWADREDFRDVINFTLDGVTYSACEDPGDGYRSSMDSLRVSSNPTTNTFPPCKVVARMQSPDQCEYRRDVLELVDAITGKVVLEVGTANTDDYYPYFVSHFAPENMAVNIER